MCIFVHIGYPKSASTTLQKHLFHKHSDINYFGLYPTKNIGQDTPKIDRNARFLTDKNLRTFYKALLMEEPDEYSHQEAVDLFRTSIKNHLSNKVNLLSHERFTSTLFGHSSLEEKAKRLKTIIPDAKIILVIRNQADLIKSQYRDMPFDPRNIRKGKPVSLKKWIDM